VIASPHNDRECLGAITEAVAAMVAQDEPHLVDLAARFNDPDKLAAWIRTLPQRDDHGLPCDGPKVDACKPAQRFRIDAEDPNCVERTGKFIGAAERIDPSSVYRMATVDTPNGLHTFPTRDGSPVILDPKQTRNALRAGLYRACRNGAGPTVLTPAQAVDWIAGLAAEPAVRFADGARRAGNGHRALRAVLGGRPLCVADLRDVVFVLALGEREARLYGPIGLRIVHSTAHAIDRLDRLAADRWLAERAEPRNLGPLAMVLGNVVGSNLPFFSSLARVGGRIAGNVGLEALKVKLASMGVTAPVLNTLESELHHEGLSLGPLAAPPPMLGTFGALAPEALAGRWLAGKF
jgi:hypothetical protein